MPYRMEGVEPLRLQREEIEAMGIAVETYPLASGVRYIRHDPDKLVTALMEVFRKYTLK